MDPPKRVLPLVDTPPSAVKRLAEYIQRYFISANRSFKDVVYKEGGGQYEFDFKVRFSELGGPVSGDSVAFRVTLTPSSVEIDAAAPPVEDARIGKIYERVADGIEFVVDSFTKKSKRTNVYFVFSTADRKSLAGHSSPGDGVGREVLRRVFKGNSMNLYLFLLVFAFVFMLFLGDFAILGILAIQGVVLFYADRLSMAAGDVHPTRDEPTVTLVSVMSSPDTASAIRKQGKALLPEIGKHLESVPGGGDSVPAVQDALKARGISCSADDIRVVTRDVYATVESAASKFKMPVPRITIDNTPLDNASATGALPSRSAITITAGALEDLDSEQLESVVGHEMGHVKGRDPVVLFCVNCVVYLGGFYLWFPLLLALGIFYFLLAFGAIYSVGKLLETRADTESARVIGQPDTLAAALTKIGFTQLYYEKYSAGSRILDWFRFDPHPPMYFRVERLQEISQEGEPVSHTLLVSLRDCLTGFAKALVGAE
jgi:heat shock protein HtpX